MVNRNALEDMAMNGLSLSDVFSLYILHESDESKFVEVANAIIGRNRKEISYYGLQDNKEQHQ